MCGVIGVIGTAIGGPKNTSKQSLFESSHECSDHSFWAAYDVYKGMLTLQHRGQDAAGILSFDDELCAFHQEKNLGLTAKVFNEE